MHPFLQSLDRAGAWRRLRRCGRSPRPSRWRCARDRRSCRARHLRREAYILRQGGHHILRGNVWRDFTVVLEVETRPTLGPVVVDLLLFHLCRRRGDRFVTLVVAFALPPQVIELSLDAGFL